MPCWISGNTSVSVFKAAREGVSHTWIFLRSTPLLNLIYPYIDLRCVLARVYVFAFGTPLPKDPTRPITSFKTAWTKVREEAKVKGRWHDNRHTLVTELAESGAGDEVIMSIAGHVSRAMLSRYSHVRMEAKRRALDEIDLRQRAADEKRQKEIERQRQIEMASQTLVIQ